MITSQHLNLQLPEYSDTADIQVINDNLIILEENLVNIDYINKNQIGAPNGIASLGADGKVPDEQLPPANAQVNVIDNLTSTSAGDALSANQGRLLNNSINGLGYGTCTTAQTTSTKIGTFSGFVRKIGSLVWLRFTNANTAASPTLNVNGTGAASIRLNGNALPAGAISAGGVYGFVFDGTYWQILNPSIPQSSSVEVINNLTSSSTTAALSANQGKELSESKANTIHTNSSGSDIGQATASLFGHARASSASPLANGTAAIGTDNGLYAREGHRHPTDTTRAPLASPGFTGTPTAPTAAQTVNSTQIATTAFVHNSLSNKANLDMPTIYELPHTHDTQLVKILYYKNQFGEVTVICQGIGKANAFVPNEIIATLPVGFRPLLWGPNSGIYDLNASFVAVYTNNTVPWTTEANTVRIGSDGNIRTSLYWSLARVTTIYFLASFISR